MGTIIVSALLAGTVALISVRLYKKHAHAKKNGTCSCSCSGCCGCSTCKSKN